jgi:hypothetical protein
VDHASANLQAIRPALQKATLGLLLCLSIAGFGHNAAAESAKESAIAPQLQGVDGEAEEQARQPLVRHRPTSTALDRRVALLAGELNLDVGQRAKVKSLLLSQRDQVSKVWSDELAPAVVRVKTTQNISDHTAEQIRALLTEEQRKRYIQPRNDKVASNTDRQDVEVWMRGGQAQSPQQAQ